MDLIKELIFGNCFVREYLHIYCPGCGGTRAIIELLHFHILESIYMNPVPICMIFDFILAAATRNAERRMDQIARYSRWRITSKIVLLVILFGNMIVKNVLLIGFGIDLLGDIY